MTETSDTTSVATGAEVAKRSRVATRRKLVEGAAPVFVEKGLEAASVADLCAAAGFTRGAFYSNFGSKTELAVAVYGYRVDLLIELLESESERLLSRGVGLDAVLTFMLEALAGLTQDGAWQSFRVEMHLAADRDIELREAVDTQYERIVEAVARALDAATVLGVRYRLPSAELARLLIAVWDGELLRAGRRRAMRDGTVAWLVRTTWDAFVVNDI